MKELANTLGDIILMAERRLEATGDEWWRKVMEKAEEAARLCARLP